MRVGDWSVACPVCEQALPVPVEMATQPAEPGADHVTAVMSADTRAVREHVEAHRAAP